MKAGNQGLSLAAVAIALFAVIGTLVYVAFVFKAPPTKQVSFRGKASWYGTEFDGRRTASGKRFDSKALTAAHRKLPFGTRLKVKNLRTGKSCEVTITDRGPFIGSRVIDLSEAAARRLGMISSGTAQVECLVLSRRRSS